VTEPNAEGGSPLRFEMQRLDGTSEDLSQYQGKVVLVVNTASECGFTPQFEGLQELYERRGGDDFAILCFPSNNFADQEPLGDAEIGEFCRANYGVSFPMFSKIEVKGPDAAPLFRELGEPDWNFNKYLLDKDGMLIRQWGARTAPDDPEITAAIERELAAG
jgi:glutathione peroxidase